MLALLLISGCATPQFLTARAIDPDPARKLGLTALEWGEIQAEFEKRKREAAREGQDLKVLHWARSKLTNMVEVACFDANLGTPPKHGPVFFFAQQDGHWHVLLHEMSEWWDDEDRSSSEDASSALSPAGVRVIRGTYRNPTLGYAVTVPRGLRGQAGGQSGPERGLEMSLPSGGRIAVWGESNSLEFASPAEGIRYAVGSEESASGQRRISELTVGRLPGAEGRSPRRWNARLCAQLWNV